MAKRKKFMEGDSGPEMHRRITLARRLYHSPEFRMKLAAANGGKPLPDRQVAGLLEEKYFANYKALNWPLQTLFAILQAVPDVKEWGPDWPKLLTRVPVAAPTATKTRRTTTRAQYLALEEEFETYKEQMASEIRRKDAEIDVQLARNRALNR